MQGTNLKLSDVTKAAHDFLDHYHPSLEAPIPIEEIVEIKMGLGLTVVPGIKLLLGIDAFINSDFTGITIDEDSFNLYPERTRFSIAHEVGHLILHKNWYLKNGPKGLTDYLTFHDRIDKEVYKYVEIQAHTFAGLVLVPTSALLTEIKAKMGKIPVNETPEILIPVAQDLLDTFKVSGEVIWRRLQKEGVIKTSR